MTKFKVGDVIKYPFSYGSSNRAFTITRVEEPSRYIFQDKFYGSIERADRICTKVNHINSKLGKILYAKSN